MRLRIAPIVAVLVVLSAVVAACGSSDSSSTSSSSAASTSTASGGANDKYAQTLATLAKGDFTQPPTSGPAAQKGKKVWFISCGQLYEACAEGAAAFKAASGELGWNTTIVDGKADPSVASAAIRQAAAAGVDGVALVAFDCPAIKAALAEAKKDKMPVVQSFSYDCGDPGIPGPPLFAASLKAKGLPLSQYRIDWGKARADYSIAKTNGTAKVISLEEQSQFTSKAANQGFDDQIKTCPKCQMVDQVKWTFAEVPNGTFTAKTLAALRQHPEATVLSVPGDAFFSLGVSQALKQSGKAGKIMVIGGEGFAPNVKLIRDGVQTASMAYDYSWAAYGLADVLNRVFAGTSSADIPDEGGGWQTMDKDNNLPAAGEKWQAPVDYKTAFAKVWGGGAG